MITSFEVGSTFRIIDQASPVLGNILRSVRSVAAFATQSNVQLAALGQNRFGGLSRSLSAVERHMEAISVSSATASKNLKALAAGASGMSANVAKLRALIGQADTLENHMAVAIPAAADKMATSVLASTDLMIGGISAAIVRVEELAAAFLPVSRAARGAATPLLAGPGGAGGLPPAAGGRGGGGRHGPHTRIGMGIPMAGGAHAHASMPGSVPLIAAGASMWGVAEMMKLAEEPMHQEAMLQLLGIDPATIERMKSEARGIAISVPGSGYATNMKNLGGLYSIVGAEGAMSIAPKLAEIDRVQSIVGGKDQGSAYVLTRAAELMGKLTDPVTHKVDMKAFGSIIDNMSKMSIATHGKVTPEEWLNYAKQAGPAAGNLTTEGLYTTATIIQAMGGHRAGTAAAAVQRQFAGGVMSASKAKELEDIGIFKAGDYEVGKGGHVMVKNDAAQSFVEKLQKDPLDAVVKDLIPALESHGFTTNEQLTKELYRILGTAPEQREIYEIIRGREQIRQERERAMGALAPGAAITALNRNDPEQVTSAFTTAFKDLLGAVGGPLMQSAIPGIRGLTSAFNELAAVAAGHPKETGVVSSGIFGTVAGAALGGVAGFFVAGPAGVVPGAMYGGGGGGVLGTAYGFMASQEGGHHQTAYERRQDRLRRQGLLPPDTDGVAGGSAWNVVPPPQKIEIAPAKVTLNMDGRAVGEATINYVVAQGNGAAQGSPYPDTTHGGSTFDFALVN